MENVFERFGTMVSDAGTQAYEKMMDILPEALLAIVIIVAGWLVATFVYYITNRILDFFAVDKLAGKTPLDRMLKNVGIQKSISSIIALLVFWMALLVTLIIASDVLHLEQVSNALAIVTRFIPQVIAALLIIVFGMLLAKFLETVVTQAVSKADIGYEKPLGKMVHLIVLLFVFIAASQQLGFNLSFITTNVMILVFAIILIGGLALIIGSRTVLENFTACKELQSHLNVGDNITIDSIQGTVESFTLTSVIIKSHDKQVVVPATQFFTHTYTIS